MSRTAIPVAETPDAVVGVAESVRPSVTRLSRILRHQDGGDLTPSAVSALAMINQLGPLTLGDLAMREHVSAPTITRVVEKLQRDGLVRRTISKADGRVVYVEVTDKGRRLVLDARSRRTKWLIEHLGALSADDLAALEHAAPVLEKLVAQATEEQQ